MDYVAEKIRESVEKEVEKFIKETENRQNEAARNFKKEVKSIDNESESDPEASESEPGTASEPEETMAGGENAKKRRKPNLENRHFAFKKVQIGWQGPKFGYARKLKDEMEDFENEQRRINAKVRDFWELRRYLYHGC